MSCFGVLFSVLFHLQLMCTTERVRPNDSQVVRSSNRAPLHLCVLVRLRTRNVSNHKSEIFLVRRRTKKTQKYKGALFEQLESGWAWSDHFSETKILKVRSVPSASLLSCWKTPTLGRIALVRPRKKNDEVSI